MKQGRVGGATQRVVVPVELRRGGREEGFLSTAAGTGTGTGSSSSRPKIDGHGHGHGHGHGSRQVCAATPKRRRPACNDDIQHPRRARLPPRASRPDQPTPRPARLRPGASDSIASSPPTSRAANTPRACNGACEYHTCFGRRASQPAHRRSTRRVLYGRAICTASDLGDCIGGFHGVNHRRQTDPLAFAASAMHVNYGAEPEHSIHIPSHGHFEHPAHASSPAFSSPFRHPNVPTLDASGLDQSAAAHRNGHAPMSSLHHLQPDNASLGSGHLAHAFYGDMSRTSQTPSTPSNASPRFSTISPSNQPKQQQQQQQQQPPPPTYLPTDRSPPSRDVSDDTIDDAYASFILYCNPNFPTSIDTTELTRLFRTPPKSDGKAFSTWTLFELIRKFDSKEIKTWTQLALDLGVEKPDTDKGQSTQKVQQYSVRLKVRVCSLLSRFQPLSFHFFIFIFYRHLPCLRSMRKRLSICERREVMYVQICTTGGARTSNARTGTAVLGFVHWAHAKTFFGVPKPLVPRGPTCNARSYRLRHSSFSLSLRR